MTDAPTLPGFDEPSYAPGFRPHPRADDGADIVCMAEPHDTRFWSRHPDVERFTATDAIEGGKRVLAIRVWLKPSADDDFDFEHRGTPGGDGDINVWGSGWIHPTFWEKHPDVEFLGGAEDEGDGEFGPQWWMSVWLRD